MQGRSVDYSNDEQWAELVRWAEEHPEQFPVYEHKTLGEVWAELSERGKRFPAWYYSG